MKKDFPADPNGETYVAFKVDLKGITRIEFIALRNNRIIVRNGLGTMRMPAESLVFDEAEAQKTYKNLLRKEAKRIQKLKATPHYVNRREEDVLRLYFQLGKTNKEIASYLGYSTERICQIKNKACRKLKESPVRANSDRIIKKLKKYGWHSLNEPWSLEGCQRNLIPCLEKPINTVSQAEDRVALPAPTAFYWFEAFR